jgi:hypothetical protein
MIKYDPLHDQTFSKQRGMLSRGECNGKGLHILFDHNYSAVRIDTPLSSPLQNTTGSFDQDGLVVADGTISMNDFIRQRSEWALELLIVGSLGLQPLPPQNLHFHTLMAPSAPIQQSTHSLAPNSTPDPSHPDPSHPSTTMQACRDYVFQHLPSLAGTSPRSTWSQHRDQREKYFDDTFGLLPLLTVLPLYETLLTLPSTQTKTAPAP